MRPLSQNSCLKRMIQRLRPECRLFNNSYHGVKWSLSTAVFHAVTLKLAIQTSLSVAPEFPVSLSSHEKCPDFRKTSTPREIGRHGPPKKIKLEKSFNISKIDFSLKFANDT